MSWWNKNNRPKGGYARVRVTDSLNGDLVIVEDDVQLYPGRDFIISIQTPTGKRVPMFRIRVSHGY